jgi:predicted porin
MRTQRTLLSAAALLAFSGAASAQMSLYGLIDVCYGKSLLADVFLDEKADVHSGGDNFSSECNSTTRVGIKGSYEVASGVKANFKFETAGIKSNGQVGEDGQAFFNRQAWAGLSGSLGEVRVGRQDSVPFQMMGDFDFNGQSNGVSAGAYSFIGSWATGRQSRSIQYIAPSMGGLSAQLGLRVKGNSQDGNKDQISGAVKYGAGPLLVGVAFESKADSAAKDFMSIAGSYDLGVAKVMASYADAGAVSGGGFGKGYMLGVVAPVAGFNVGAHYANNGDSLLEIKSWEVFINKEIFKNTYAYLEAGNWKASPSDGGATLALIGAQKLKGSAAAAGVIFVF